MKKVISLMIAVLMLASMLCMSAFATEYGDEDFKNGTITATQDVSAKYVEGTRVDAYKVVLTWGSMNFNYSDKSEKWNPDTHKWETTSEAAWAPAADGADKITIVNHSSKAVTAAFSFTPTAEGISGNFGETSVTVGSAAENKAAVTKTVTFQLDGALTKTEENAAGYVKIGTITVTLN